MVSETPKEEETFLEMDVYGFMMTKVRAAFRLFIQKAAQQ
jgi:hypothetical protein